QPLQALLHLVADDVALAHRGVDDVDLAVVTHAAAQEGQQREAGDARVELRREVLVVAHALRLGGAVVAQRVGAPGAVVVLVPQRPAQALDPRPLRALGRALVAALLAAATQLARGEGRRHARSEVADAARADRSAAGRAGRQVVDGIRVAAV